MRFHFIHAADLHIDSPLASLGLKDLAVAARFARANRDAVEALVKETIDGRAAFLIIAGDIFDGDWRDVSTGLFFTRALGDLHRAGVDLPENPVSFPLEQSENQDARPSARRAPGPQLRRPKPPGQFSWQLP